MREQGEGKSATPREQHIGSFAWAKRHPGVMLLSALAIPILALPKSPTTETIESDTSGEEVPSSFVRSTSSSVTRCCWGSTKRLSALPASICAGPSRRN